MYRKSTVNDCIAIYDLICELENTELPFDRFTDIYKKQLNDNKYYCLVYEHDARIIGILNLRFEEQLHHADRIAEIMEFIVHPSYRSIGIGKEMLRAACELAKKFGCIQIELASDQQRPYAHRFYIREGMQNSHFKFYKTLT